ncbi:MAG: PPC domain-containing DNA-binding protein [Candidatus Krumholzibacteriia bacterium]
MAVVLRRGEDVHESLVRLAREAELRSAFIVGLGAIEEAVLAFYDPELKEYQPTEIRGVHEVGNLTGNLTRVDGEPFAHIHVVIGGRDLGARTGHLVSARVGATMELFVRDLGTEIARSPNAEIGLKLWDL